MVACWQQGPNLQCFVQKLQVEWLKVLFCYTSRFISLYMLPSTDRLHFEQAQYVVPLKGYPRMGEAAGFGQSLTADLQLGACKLHLFLFLTHKPPEPLGKTLEWGVSSVSYWDNAEGVCWHWSCPAGKHLWCESCQGRMMFGTWLHVSVLMRITCIAQCCPSAKLLFQGSLYWPTTWVLWRKVVCQAVHRGAKSGLLHSMSSCSRGLQCCVALCLGQDWLQWNVPGFQPGRLAAGILPENRVQKFTGALILLRASRLLKQYKG